MSSVLPLIEEHKDALPPESRFGRVVYQGAEWDLAHLQPFAFRHAINPELTVDVVVFFSCHCFTHDMKKDQRDDIPEEEIYDDGRELRVLNPERYELSRQQLPSLVEQLASRHIRVMAHGRPNFLTVEIIDRNGVQVPYTVFFEVTKDRSRRKRMILRVQSAHARQELTKRQAKARKVRLDVLLRAVYEGREIKA